MLRVVFLPLHISDGLLSLPGTREAAIQRLLQVRMFVFACNIGTVTHVITR
jgi:hypothetical protein